MKARSVFVCQACGKSFSKWMGRCQDCGEWNSVVEEIVRDSQKVAPGASIQPEDLASVKLATFERLKTNIGEFDTVLGGGLVPGCAILLGGEPGIGKSTLLLQATCKLAASGATVLYASGEESTSQIALRAQRLGLTKAPIKLLSETDLGSILTAIENEKPSVVVIDSIQTLSSQQLESQPGTVGQIRECAFSIISLCKSKNISVLFVGHVTKEGSIAGPKILEHMVDAVLYFESSSNHMFRLLRSMKNRFGSTNEIGIFEMRSDGMKEVSNPSEVFLSERNASQPGSVVTSTIEGSRPILVEIQSLVSYSTLAIPRRTSLGMDPNRVCLLVAILEKRAGFRLHDQDVYVNVAGGIRIQETASDLATIAAMASSFSGKPIPQDSVFIGEVGLGGEVRNVTRIETRLKEASRVGFKTAFVPKGAKKELPESPIAKLVTIEHVGQLSDYL